MSAAVLGSLGTIVEAANTIGQGRAAGRRNAFEAAMLDGKAARRRAEAVAEVAARRRQGRGEQAALRTRLAAAGVEADAGTALLARASRAAEDELALRRFATVAEGDARAIENQARQGRIASPRALGAGKTLLRAGQSLLPRP